MDPIQLAVQAFILTLFPQNVRGTSGRPPATSGQVLRLDALDNGLAIPSFWTATEINAAFAVANTIWAQAAIEFTPISVSRRTEVVPADERGMWIRLVNNLSTRSGIAAAFVDDLPSNEGGWGGGRVVVVAQADNALQGFHGRILAHELGHVLLNTPHHLTVTRNLMYGQRHPRVVTADRLEPRQIRTARSRAQTL